MKFKSRKFWLSVAAALASLGAGISGLVVGNEKLALVSNIDCNFNINLYFLRGLG